MGFWTQKKAMERTEMSSAARRIVTKTAINDAAFYGVNLNPFSEGTEAWALYNWYNHEGQWKTRGGENRGKKE